MARNGKQSGPQLCHWHPGSSLPRRTLPGMESPPATRPALDPKKSVLGAQLAVVVPEEWVVRIQDAIPDIVG